MSKHKSHRFQSSREVFEEYIPDYKNRESHEAEQDGESSAAESGSKLASDLVDKLRRSITKPLSG